MRLALLSAAMINAREFGVDEAVLLNMIASQNAPLLATVPEGLREIGHTVDAVWTKLLPGPQVRYQFADTLPLRISFPSCRSDTET